MKKMKQKNKTENKHNTQLLMCNITADSSVILNICCFDAMRISACP